MSARKLRILFAGEASLLLACAFFSCAIHSQGERESARKEDAATTPADAEVIHNLRQVSGGVYSGGEPHGDAAFDRLADLGVRTIVSVDGASPDLEAAHRRGMRYVHIPFSYDGVPKDAALALTRALRECDRPIFFHCYHGKHRGPAGTAIACIGAGLLDQDAALAFLEEAGTSKNYTGLWRDVAAFQPPPEDAVLPELVEAAVVPHFAAAMAAVDRASDNLALCAASGWQTPPNHPDLDPAQEALILWEGMRESQRTNTHKGDARFEAWLAESEQDAQSLHEALEDGRLDAASEHFLHIKQSCAQCHALYRNQ